MHVWYRMHNIISDEEWLKLPKRERERERERENLAEIKALMNEWCRLGVQCKYG